MNWAVWGPVLGTMSAGVLGLIGLIFQSRKNHHAAIEQISVLQKQANAATKQAEAAMEAAKASVRTAEATAEAAIQDAFTRAYEAASRNWARFCDANDRTIENLREQVAENNARIDESEIRAEGYRQARDEVEKKFRVAVAWMRRAIRWINENMPGASYPPLPSEIDLDLYDL
jgi:chromosome segregation ATPase